MLILVNQYSKKQIKRKETIWQVILMINVYAETVRSNRANMLRIIIIEPYTMDQVIIAPFLYSSCTEDHAKFVVHFMGIL